MPKELGPESLEVGARSRKVLLAACGTRGDVQPFLALAVALRRHGHHPLLAAPSSYAADAAAHGVDFAAIDDGPTRILDETATRRIIDNGLMGVRGKVAAARTVARLKHLLIAPLRDVAAIAHDHGDVAAVVHSAAFPAQHVADMLDVPAVVVALQPGWIPTDTFPCQLMPLPECHASSTGAHTPWSQRPSGPVKWSAGGRPNWAWPLAATVHGGGCGTPRADGGPSCSRSVGTSHRPTRRGATPYAPRVSGTCPPTPTGRRPVS